MTLHGLSIGGRRFDQTLTLKPGDSATVAFEVAAATPELTLDVSFENPDAAERGTLALRRTLPPRPAADPTTVSGPSGHWAKGEDDFVIPREVYAEILAKQGGADFLNAFFSDNEWVLDFLTSGDPLTDWPTSLRALDTICWLCPEVYDSPILRRWATAAALNAAADPTDVIFLLQEMLAIRREGFLWRGADDLRCDQLRYTLIPAQCDADNARWLAPRHNVPPRQYGGVCWAAPYRLNNFFGDSIHGSDYYKPWEHAYLRHEASRKVGAVCGGLSYYGSAAAKTHGSPPTAPTSSGPPNRSVGPSATTSPRTPARTSRPSATSGSSPTTSSSPTPSPAPACAIPTAPSGRPATSVTNSPRPPAAPR